MAGVLGGGGGTGEGGRGRRREGGGKGGRGERGKEQAEHKGVSAPPLSCPHDCVCIPPG